MFELPHFEKFMPLWMCCGLSLAVLAGFLALLIVLVANSRKRDDDKT
jgi:hypothetical protein